MHGIERVLGEKIERRTLKGFDYKKTAPARDSEFARPPRAPQRRREQKKPEPFGTRTAAVGPQKGHHVQPTRGVAHRGSAPQRPSDSATLKDRGHKPFTGR